MKESNVFANIQNEMWPQTMDLVTVKVTRGKLPWQKLSSVKSDIDKNLSDEPRFWYKMWVKKDLVPMKIVSVNSKWKSENIGNSLSELYRKLIKGLNWLNGVHSGKPFPKENSSKSTNFLVTCLYSNVSSGFSVGFSLRHKGSGCGGHCTWEPPCRGTGGRDGQCLWEWALFYI